MHSRPRSVYNLYQIMQHRELIVTAITFTFSIKHDYRGFIQRRQHLAVLENPLPWQRQTKALALINRFVYLKCPSTDICLTCK